MKNIFDPDSRQDFIIPALGIAPLVAITDSLETGTIMGIISLLAVVVVSMIVSAVKYLLPVEVRLIAIMLIAATVVSLLHIFLQLCFFEVSEKLGIYIPLIAMNCMVLAWAEGYALSNGILKSLLQTVQAGAAMLVLLIVIGTVREYAGLSLLKQPAGAFLVFGFLAALYCFACNRRQSTR